MNGLDLPHLTMGKFTLTSPVDEKYNCVSHSVYEKQISYWPDNDNRWPQNVTRAETVSAFVEFFVHLGYREILISETSYESGFEKIAIYGDNGLPLHVARQLPSGRWTSKFGTLVDVDHVDLGCLEHGMFGHVVKIMKRVQNNRAPVVQDVVPPRSPILRP